MDEAPGDLEAPLHAARVLLDERRGLLFKIDQAEDLVDSPPALGLAHAVHHGVELEVLPAGELDVQGGLLEDDADALADAVTGFRNVVAGYLGRSGSRFEES